MKNKIKFLCTSLILIFLFSCQEDDFLENIEKETLYKNIDQLGEKLENPFSINNMRKALDSLKLRGNQYRDTDFKIETTHLYLRFKPKNEQELNVLEADTTLILYSYPLDHKIPEGLTSYHDSSIPKNKPTFQYCAVPVSYDFPHDIKVKILEELYLPREDKKNNARSLDNLLYDLEKEAFLITGNEFELKSEGNSASRAAGFTPSGTIRVWDDVIGSTVTSTRTFSHYVCYDCNTGQTVSCGSGGIKPVPISGGGGILDPGNNPVEDPVCQRAVYNYSTTERDGSYIPIQGVKIRARRWFTTKSGITDENGEFNINHSFGGDVNYMIVWEHLFWDIRDGNLTQAYYNGPQMSSPWNLNIGGGKSLRFTTIHRACHRYTFEDVDNLSRPILGGGSKLKINYNDGEGTGVNWGLEWQNVDFGTGLLPNIKIWRSSENLERDWFTNEIFSTTIHELAHTTHIQEMNWGTIDYGQVRPILYESWADAVEWYLTRKEYIERGEADYDDPTVRGFRNTLADNKQWWNFNDSHEYTPIFIDLIDDYNQATQFEPTLPVDNSKPNENITGYWMQTIEDVVLKDAYGLTSLRNELKRHKPSGVTDAQIDNYMAFYFNNL